MTCGVVCDGFFVRGRARLRAQQATITKFHHDLHAVVQEVQTPEALLEASDALYVPRDACWFCLRILCFAQCASASHRWSLCNVVTPCPFALRKWS